MNTRTVFPEIEVPVILRWNTSQPPNALLSFSGCGYADPISNLHINFDCNIDIIAPLFGHITAKQVHAIAGNIIRNLFLFIYITHFNQRQKEMEAYEAQSKSTKNAGSVRKRVKRRKRKKGVDGRKWHEVSDFVARFCTLRE